MSSQLTRIYSKREVMDKFLEKKIQNFHYQKIHKTALNLSPKIFIAPFKGRIKFFFLELIFHISILG
jgi:hypothetical protein